MEYVMILQGFDNFSFSVRAAANAELQADLAAGTQFNSNRLRDTAVNLFFELLQQSLEAHDDIWLVDQLDSQDCMAPMYWTKTGKHQKTPSNAAVILGRGEFKRYYVRGVCVAALAQACNDLEYYRAYESLIHREQSDRLVGARISAEELLSLARSLSADGEPYSGPPCEFGSGLCIRIPEVSIK